VSTTRLWNNIIQVRSKFKTGVSNNPKVFGNTKTKGHTTE